MQAKLAVFVDHFRFPPTQHFTEAIGRMLKENYAGYVGEITSGTARNRSFTRGLEETIQYCMEQAKQLMKNAPGVVLAGSIVPSQLEIVDCEGTAVKQNTVFVSVRNIHGHEWFFAHYVGVMNAPVEVTEMIGDSVNQILEERGSQSENIEKDEIDEVIKFIELLIDGVTFVFAVGTKKTLQ